MSSPKVILSEDVRQFKPTLLRDGITVYTVMSGQDAIEIHQKERANLIILSRYMPGIDGEEACKRIKGNNAIKDVAIIMLVGGLKTDDIEGYISSIGADDYIIKPFTPAEFVNKVGRFINIPIRQSVRILTKLTVDVKSGTESFTGNIIDMSISGVMMETERQMDIGTALKCEFTIPEPAKLITVTGNVVRKIDGRVPPLKRYGIRFLNLDSKSATTIEKFVFKQQRQQIRERVR